MDQKKSFLSIFRLKFEKARVIFEIGTLQIMQIPEIKQSNNNDNSNNIKRNQKMPYLGILARNFGKLLLYLKSASSSFLKCKKLFKTKKSKISETKCLIWAFWAVSFKGYWYIWNQLPRICQNGQLCTFCIFHFNVR